MEAIDYMLNNAPENDVDDVDIEPVMFNGMEIDGIDDEDDEAEITEVCGNCSMLLFSKLRLILC